MNFDSALKDFSLHSTMQLTVRTISYELSYAVILTDKMVMVDFVGLLDLMFFLSTSQAIVGAIIGWNLFSNNLTDQASLI